MKLIYATMVVLFGTASGFPGGRQMQEEEAAREGLTPALWKKAWDEKNVEDIASMFAEDATVWGPEGPVRGMEDIKTMLQGELDKGIAGSSKMKLKAAIEPDAAYQWGDEEEEGANTSPPAEFLGASKKFENFDGACFEPGFALEWKAKGDEGKMSGLDLLGLDDQGQIKVLVSFLDDKEEKDLKDAGDEDDDDDDDNDEDDADDDDDDDDDDEDDDDDDQDDDDVCIEGLAEEHEEECRMLMDTASALMGPGAAGTEEGQEGGEEEVEGAEEGQDVEAKVKGAMAEGGEGAVFTEDMFIEDAKMTFNGEKVKGKTAISEVLASLSREDVTWRVFRPYHEGERFIVAWTVSKQKTEDAGEAAEGEGEMVAEEGKAAAELEDGDNIGETEVGDAVNEDAKVEGEEGEDSGQAIGVALVKLGDDGLIKKIKIREMTMPAGFEGWESEELC